jgi:hypothetical protein
VKITIEVPDDLVNSYIERAGAAVGYWCESWDNPEDGVVVLKCHDDDQEYRFGRDAIVAGLRHMAAKYPHHFRDLVADTGDMYTGDILVQLAAFGEERYC